MVKTNFPFLRVSKRKKKQEQNMQKLCTSDTGK